MNQPTADPELERQLRLSRPKGGHPADVRERDRAVAWLLEHPERAYPTVLARATTSPGDASLIELLGRFRKVESTSVLMQAFQRPEPVRRYAAAALGLSPDPEARKALIEALAEPSTQVAAIAGLEASGDATLGPRIRELLRSPTAEVRWVAVHACKSLGCISEQELSELARGDADPSVRELAEKGPTKHTQ